MVTQKTKPTIDQCATRGTMGCKHPPLLQFEVCDIIIDELHLMLRITDVLLRNLVWAMVQLDITNRTDEVNISKLVLAIKLCGISFKVWKDKDGTGRTNIIGPHCVVVIRSC